ncbi:Uu.00g006090.m01.CDS01 [Anthostomella pinea]|uniref:Uu.00g006090.m01.CDS01 n=1 Tax=Anthostomella pinea TaxID=933095 RepID=A0AAI8YGJ7_9PEZI|nr:Uu.00g006090.m01.CDS01 [Anthostomella pinea]
MASTTREPVNPLRPYYIPPTIGDQSDSLPSRPSPSSHANATSGNYASKARDIFPDLDYNNHLDEISPSTVQSVKQTVDELLWKYTSVLMAQPFEVAKTILQVRSQDDLGALGAAPVEAKRPVIARPRRSVYDEYPDSDSEPDDYFTSNAPYTPTPSHRTQHRRGSSPIESPKANAKPTLLPHQLGLRRPDSIFDVLSQLWSKEWAWGVWKGTNTTFLYTVLQSLLENWSRSLLSALLNVPDLGVKDDVERLVDIASPYPWASLCVAAAAAVATGLILAPLDLVRTRLIVTSTGRAPRRTLATLRALPSWLCPSILIGPTILNSLVHPFLTLSTPLVLRSQFLIDRELSPTTFSIAKFCTSCASLFIKLPLETVLRRGQMAVLLQPNYVEALDRAGNMDIIVRPGPYNGVIGTMYTIVAEEGSRAVSVPAKSPQRGRKGNATVSEVVYKKGQGLGGLWRGWKVSWWGLVGLWTAGIAGGGGEGEF